jgi:hypothetical protein
MKNRKVLFGFIAILFAFAIIACPSSSGSRYSGTDDDCTHNWGNWSVTTPATCIAEGEETRVCNSNSTHIETRAIAIDPNAHTGNWSGDWSITTFPTSITPLDGEETGICISCNEPGTRLLIEANFKPYFYGNWVNTVGDLNDPPANISVGNNTLTISPDSLEGFFENFFDPKTRTFTSLTWELVTNPNTLTAGNNDTNAEYPMGFKLDGDKTGTHDPMFVALGQNGILVTLTFSGSARQFIFERE